MNRTGLDVWFAASMVLAACASAAPSPVVKAEPPAAALASAPSPAVSSVPIASASSADTGHQAAAASSESGDAKTAKAKDKLDSGGKPLTIYAGPSQPVTVGRDGAVVRAQNGAELRILADSLAEPRNVLVIVDRKAHGTTGKMGDIYELPVQVPAQEIKAGAPVTVQPYESFGPPFILKLPLPNGVKSANLAIERVSSDPKTKKVSSSWTVVPMTKVDSSSGGDKAVFELKALPGTHVHLTSMPAETEK